MEYDAKDINPITVALCRGMFEYDVNQIVPEAEDRDNKQVGGHSDSREG